MTKTIYNAKIERKHHNIDAANQSVGRLATKIATLLIGKHKVNYTPNVDNGDLVTVSNVGKLSFSGKKLEQRKLYSHSGYPGGLKVKKVSMIFKDKPEQILKNAVWKMLPKNRLRDIKLKRMTFKK